MIKAEVETRLMGNIRPKTSVTMKVGAICDSHSRSRISVRDVGSVVDEPVERHGTNLGPTPTETLMASLLGCTNVISHKIAAKMGFAMGDMEISLSATFDRRGTMLEEELEHPFSDIVMDIRVKTDGTPAQMAAMQADLAKFCPIAKVIRGSGVTITENWTTEPL